MILKERIKNIAQKMLDKAAQDSIANPDSAYLLSKQVTRERELKEIEEFTTQEQIDKWIRANKSKLSEDDLKFLEGG